MGACYCVNGAMPERKKIGLCDITPTSPHWFKLPIIPLSRARRVERM